MKIGDEILTRDGAHGNIIKIYDQIFIFEQNGKESWRYINNEYNEDVKYIIIYRNKNLKFLLNKWK